MDAGQRLADGGDTADIEVVTVATHADGWFDALAASCRRTGLAPPTVLGWGEPWCGFMHKVRAVRACVADRPPRALLLFVDAYDVLVLAPAAADLRRRYDACRGDRPVVVGVERSADPLSAWLKRYKFGGCAPGRILNSGVYMGPAAALADLLDRWLAVAAATGDNDDQRTLNRLCRDSDHDDWFRRTVAVDDRGDLI